MYTPIHFFRMKKVEGEWRFMVWWEREMDVLWWDVAFVDRDSAMESNSIRSSSIHRKVPSSDWRWKINGTCTWYIFRLDIFHLDIFHLDIYPPLPSLSHSTPFVLFLLGPLFQLSSSFFSSSYFSVHSSSYSSSSSFSIFLSLFFSFFFFEFSFPQSSSPSLV